MSAGIAHMTRAYEKRYHFIYKTTCVVTGKWYIGMHSTDVIEDGYVGSGKRLWYSINKYGIDNHIRVILEYADDRSSLALREKEIVNEVLLHDKNCLNLNIGGEGDWTHVNRNRSPEYRTYLGSIGGFVNRHKWSDAAEENFRLQASKNMSQFMNDRWKNKQELMEEIRQRAIKKAAAPEAIEKRRKTFEERKHQSGQKNSQFGTCWIYHELIGNKKCKRNLLPFYIDQGWLKGRF